MVHPVSRRQINVQLDVFGLAPETTAFDVGCLNHVNGRMSLRKKWTARQVRRAFGWLAARNASGSSCYIRPALAIPQTRWILVDELTDGTLNRLTAAHVPSMVIQTAADSFQVWLRLERPVDAVTRTAVARFFTRECGGDVDVVDGAQFGLIPGTTNRTPSRVRDGRALFAILRSTSTKAVTPFPPDLELPGGWTRPRGGGDVEVEGGIENYEPSGDRDFAIACRLLEAGADDHTIAAAIAVVRGFDRKSRGGYIPRTIRAARLHIQTRSE